MDRGYKSNKTLGPYVSFSVETSSEYWPLLYYGKGRLIIRGFDSAQDVVEWTCHILDSFEKPYFITCRGQSWGSLDYRLTKDEAIEALHYNTRLIFEAVMTEMSSCFYCHITHIGDAHPVYNWKEIEPGVWVRFGNTLIPAEPLEQ